jgi:magnesium-dependent phosphatase 1
MKLELLMRTFAVLIGVGLSAIIDQVACFQYNSKCHVSVGPNWAARRSNGNINSYSYSNSNSNGNSRLFALPRVIVFDLDNTLWTPELYKLRKLEGSNQIPVAGRDVNLFDGAKEVLESILPNLGGSAADGDNEKPILAIASRTNKVEWAEDLLDQFQLRDLFGAIEIFPGIKTNHFAKIQRKTKVPFHEMMFFDDARDGKYGNCEPVAAMGVFCVHCPDGLRTKEVFEHAMDLYENKWDKTPNTIVEANGDMVINVPRQYEKSPDPSSSKKYEGVVKLIKRDKFFGFVKFRTDYGKQETKDVFFHFSNLIAEPDKLKEGDKVSFQIRKDYKNKNKDMAFNVDLATTDSDDDDDSKKVQFRCFSMNNPFAALLANGYKTLESRNGTMFTEYSEGTQMLLHVGRRTYPDGGKHLEIMKAAQPGITDDEIQKLKFLPKGFSKGNIVAILEIGKTYETTTAERSDPEFERKVVAYGSDSGRIVTEIKRVSYLKQPIRQSGESGVFSVKVDPDMIPDGWTVPSATMDTRVFEISG